MSNFPSPLVHSPRSENRRRKLRLWGMLGSRSYEQTEVNKEALALNADEGRRRSESVSLDTKPSLGQPILDQSSEFRRRSNTISKMFSQTDSSYNSENTSPSTSPTFTHPFAALGRMEQLNAGFEIPQEIWLEVKGPLTDHLIKEIFVTLDRLVLSVFPDNLPPSSNLITPSPHPPTTPVSPFSTSQSTQISSPSTSTPPPTTANISAKKKRRYFSLANNSTFSLIASSLSSSPSVSASPSSGSGLSGSSPLGTGGNLTSSLLGSSNLNHSQVEEMGRVLKLPSELCVCWPEIFYRRMQVHQNLLSPKTIDAYSSLVKAYQNVLQEQPKQREDFQAPSPSPSYAARFTRLHSKSQTNCSRVNGPSREPSPVTSSFQQMSQEALRTAKKHAEEFSAFLASHRYDPDSSLIGLRPSLHLLRDFIGTLSLPLSSRNRSLDENHTPKNNINGLNGGGNLSNNLNLNMNIINTNTRANSISSYQDVSSDESFSQQDEISASPSPLPSPFNSPSKTPPPILLRTRPPSVSFQVPHLEHRPSSSDLAQTPLGEASTNSTPDYLGANSRSNSVSCETSSLTGAGPSGSNLLSELSSDGIIPRRASSYVSSSNSTTPLPSPGKSRYGVFDDVQDLEQRLVDWAKRYPSSSARREMLDCTARVRLKERDAVVTGDVVIALLPKRKGSLGVPPSGDPVPAQRRIVFCRMIKSLDREHAVVSWDPYESSTSVCIVPYFHVMALSPREQAILRDGPNSILNMRGLVYDAVDALHSKLVQYVHENVAAALAECGVDQQLLKKCYPFAVNDKKSLKKKITKATKREDDVLNDCDEDGLINEEDEEDEEEENEEIIKGCPTYKLLRLEDQHLLEGQEDLLLHLYRNSSTLMTNVETYSQTQKTEFLATLSSTGEVPSRNSYRGGPAGKVLGTGTVTGVHLKQMQSQSQSPGHSQTHSYSHSRNHSHPQQSQVPLKGNSPSRARGVAFDHTQVVLDDDEDELWTDQLLNGQGADANMNVGGTGNFSWLTWFPDPQQSSDLESSRKLFQPTRDRSLHNLSPKLYRRLAEVLLQHSLNSVRTALAWLSSHRTDFLNGRQRRLELSSIEELVQQKISRFLRGRGFDYEAVKRRKEWLSSRTQTVSTPLYTALPRVTSSPADEALNRNLEIVRRILIPWATPSVFLETTLSQAISPLQSAAYSRLRRFIAEAITIIPFRRWGLEPPPSLADSLYYQDNDQVSENDNRDGEEDIREDGPCDEVWWDLAEDRTKKAQDYVHGCLPDSPEKELLRDMIDVFRMRRHDLAFSHAVVAQATEEENNPGRIDKTCLVNLEKDWCDVVPVCGMVLVSLKRLEDEQTQLFKSGGPPSYVRVVPMLHSGLVPLL